MLPKNVVDSDLVQRWLKLHNKPSRKLPLRDHTKLLDLFNVMDQKDRRLLNLDQVLMFAEAVLDSTRNMETRVSAAAADMSELFRPESILANSRKCLNQIRSHLNHFKKEGVENLSQMQFVDLMTPLVIGIPDFATQVPSKQIDKNKYEK